MNVEKIKELCRDRDISVSELERALELGHGAVAKWDVNTPSVTRAQAVADYFGVPLKTLM